MSMTTELRATHRHQVGKLRVNATYLEGDLHEITIKSDQSGYSLRLNQIEARELRQILMEEGQCWPTMVVPARLSRRCS